MSRPIVVEYTDAEAALVIVAVSVYAGSDLSQEDLATLRSASVKVLAAFGREHAQKDERSAV